MSAPERQVGIASIKLTDDEIDAAVAVMRSGALRQGKECEAFENEFAAKVGAKHAVCNSSGTAALHLAYMTFLEPGDEVLVPSFTFIATATSVVAAGGKPIFCDVDPKSFLLDLADAESRITKKTKAISPVHLYGNACNIEAVETLAKKHDLKIVWDSAQAHGATWRESDVGSFGDFVCYSFYPSKNMFVGEGGMVCTNDSAMDEKLRLLRAHGDTGRYTHTQFGLNYRMTDVEAAIGRKQLNRLDEMISVRRRNAQILNEKMADIPGIKIPKANDSVSHAWHQYCILVDKDAFGLDRDELIDALAARGVSSGVHYPRGLHQQPVFVDRYGEQSLPITESHGRSVLALPVHHGMSEDDAVYVAQAVRACAA